ncbi:TetR/AcrR family transcriptional regulator [Allobranchiibius sp. CTAmp26]|uniref:TetR/AcrR family transcriptional regulator n=1 Tax=Allobranchiibius sp. CTAmp26 TaxID=2815214 RepID=UPI001AA17F12|nr:TetR/AcrR family transcriptional regulator [Allobranchiibius sp. CTAmp26]MBO1753524.1 TetR/AcrR family transcriptional regulator [Allobranchiibius sp. CTAmp26]
MPTRAPRADAVVNRARIVSSARAALVESGGSVEGLRLQAVAKDAQVGQGTLYRHFPTREHLVAEVYRQEMTELVQTVPALLAEHPPLQALELWLDRLLEYARVKRGVVAAIEASAWQDLYADNEHRLDHALQTLLDEGAAAGAVREGVDATDVILLLGALSRVPEGQWDARAHTLVTVILDGLRRYR